MGLNFVSDKTKQRWNDAAAKVENLPAMPVAPRRRVRTKSKGGGGAERPYVIITSVTDAENYIGDVLGGPADLSVKTTGVAIVVSGATSNDYSVGATGFCDLVDAVYYLSGGVLG